MNAEIVELLNKQPSEQRITRISKAREHAQRLASKQSEAVAIFWDAHEGRYTFKVGSRSSRALEIVEPPGGEYWD